LDCEVGEDRVVDALFRTEADSWKLPQLPRREECPRIWIRHPGYAFVAVSGEDPELASSVDLERESTVELSVVSRRTGRPVDLVEIGATIELAWRNLRSGSWLEVPRPITAAPEEWARLLAPPDRRDHSMDHRNLPEREAEAGKVRLHSLRGGAYRLTVLAPGHVPTLTNELYVREGESFRLRPLLLSESSRVCGHLRPTSETSTVALVLWEEVEGSASGKTRVDGAGAFCLDGLREGQAHRIWPVVEAREGQVVEVIPPAEGTELHWPTGAAVAGEISFGAALPSSVSLEIFPNLFAMSPGLTRVWRPISPFLQSDLVVVEPVVPFALELPDYPKVVLKLSAEGHGPELIPLDRGEPPEFLEVFLEPARAVAGKVVDEQRGSGIAGAGVSAECGVDLVVAVKAMSENDGEFLLEGLPGGDCRLFVEHPEYAPFAEDLEVGTQRALVELQPGARIAARVVDSEGRGVAEVEVRLATPALAGRTFDFRTQADGRLVVEGLLPGEYLATLEHGRHGKTQVVLVAKSGMSSEQRVVLEPTTRWEASVTGVGQRAEERLEMVLRKGRARYRARVGEGGRFRLEHGPVGQVDYSLWGSRGSLCSGRVEAPPGETFLASLACGGDFDLRVLLPAAMEGGLVSLIPREDGPGYRSLIGDQGAVLLAGVIPGDYELHLFEAGLRRSVLWRGTISGDEVLDLRLKEGE
jgi:hypothetical protein